MSEPNVFDKMYQAWEQQTAEYFDKLLRNDAFLDLTGGMMNTALRSKVAFDQMLSALWKGLLLPNKRDQERTLHLLNELHSRINDIEERLDDLAEAKQPRKRARPAVEEN